MQRSHLDKEHQSSVKSLKCFCDGTFLMQNILERKMNAMYGIILDIFTILICRWM